MYEKNNRQTYLMNKEATKRVDNILVDAEKAMRAGDPQYAYELSLRATQIAPKDIDAWILRATLAPSLEERIQCINRLNELQPDHPDRHSVAFFTLKETLDRDPYLAYLEETEQLYRVFNTDRTVLSIPKRRSIMPPFPDERKDKFSATRRWLVLSIFGLLLAGIGTLVFAPIAALSAFQAGQSNRSDSGQFHSAVMLVAAMILFVVGLVFSYLLVIHLIA